VFDYKIEDVAVSLAGEAVVFDVVVDGEAGSVALPGVEGTECLFSLEFKPILGFEERLERDSGFNQVYEVIIQGSFLIMERRQESESVRE